MKKLYFLVIVLGLFIILQMGMFVWVNGIQNRISVQPVSFSTLSDLTTSSNVAAVSKSWRDLLYKSYSVVSYKGTLEKVEYDKVLDDKAPLILTFSNKKKQIYFFSEEEMAKTRLISRGQVYASAKELNLKNGDVVIITLKYENSQKPKLEEIVLEKL